MGTYSDPWSTSEILSPQEFHVDDLEWKSTATPSIAQLARTRGLELASSEHSQSRSTISQWELDASADTQYTREPQDQEDPTNAKANDLGVIEISRPPSSSHVSGDSMSKPHQVAFIAIVCLAQFLSLAGLNQTVAPVLALARYFHIEDYGTLSWLSASYSLSVGTFILPAGRLGDMYGHKRIFLIGWAWFACWSLVTGFSYSSNIKFFAICRALQGIGPALLVPNAIALIGRTFPVGEKRNLAFACFGAAGPTGATAGAVFMALLTDLAWWPWGFWILAIACTMAAGAAHLIIQDSDAKFGSKTTERQAFDYWGCITGVTGLILVNFALNQAPLVTWANPYIGSILGIGILFLGAFIWVELYVTANPLIPLRGLQKEAIIALACIFSGWASHGIWAYYLYLFLEHLRGHSALLTSAETSPVAITGVLFAISTVWLIKRIRVNYIMLIAMGFFTLGSLLLALMPIKQTYWSLTFISVLIMPGAMNLSFPAATILLSAALPKEKQGIAASLVSTMVNYSISCGLGLAGTIDRYLIEKEARKRGIEGNPAPIHKVDAETQAIRLVGLRGAYWFAVALSAFGMLIAASYIFVSRKSSTKA